MGFILEIESAEFSWNSDCDTKSLDIQLLEIERKGQVIAVIGQSGSGKSSLLQAILGEMHLLRGTRHLDRDAGISYAAQRSWVFNATLKDNVTWYNDYDGEWYDEVIRACALDYDRASLTDKDETEIGELGVNVSGGQKARICLARAIYSQKQLYLLDDPLSAVDAKVAEHIFNEAIMRLLAQRGKTVVLVTHSLHLAAQADHVIVMKNGQMCDQGSWKEIEKLTWDGVESPSLQVEEAQREHLNSTATIPTLDDCVENYESWHTGKDERPDSRFQLRTVALYLRAIPWYFLCLTALGFLSVTSFTTATNYFLTKWSSVALLQAGNVSQATPPDAHADKSYYMYRVYTYLLSATIGVIAVLQFTGIFTGYFASRHLHESMVEAVTKAPMFFFDTHLQGTILNRFSNDVFVLDNRFLVPIEMTIQNVLNQIAAMLLQVMASGVLIVIVIPFILSVGFLVKIITPALIDLMRLKNVSISPVLAHLTQTIWGLVTVRANRCERNMLIDYAKLADHSQACYILYQVMFRWLIFRLQVALAIFAYLASTIGLILVMFGWSNPYIFGLALTYSMQALSDLRAIAFYGTEGLAQINSIDRISYYCQITPEPGREGPEEKPDRPSKQDSAYRYNKLQEEEDQFDILCKEESPSPEIKYENVCLRYHDAFPSVLRQVSLTIPSGCSFGFCGRTGSGKTSFIYGLFRLINISEGKITLAGQNIEKIPLLQLRNSMTIIPQDPVLFNDSVRYNLDPFDQYSDTDLWESLEIVQLKNRINSLGNEISEQGANFSAGERQLFCLARAFLQKSQVLVLDEVTSCVDYETEHVIQQVLAEYFEKTTVITIAHRVTSLLKCDLVAVMSDGRLVETGPPQDLLNVAGGEFRALVDACSS